MSSENYQSNFSQLYPAAAADMEGRRRKAATIAAIFADHVGGVDHLRRLRLLDVGAGNGVIDHVLADSFLDIVGLDIDEDSIKLAKALPSKPNLEFRVGDAMNLPAPDGTIDAVLCAHVYEHVPSAGQLIKEIGRVLKPGGLCYFAAGNRYQWTEPHHQLPLLSVIPKPMAHLYLRALGRGAHYFENHLSLHQLRTLVRDFRVHDYTRRMIDEPERFRVDYMLRPNSLKHRVAAAVGKLAYGLVPTYVWLLEKPAD